MGKRRTFTPEFKLQVVLDLLSARKSNAEICREHALAALVVTTWKEQFLERAPTLFANGQSHSAEQKKLCWTPKTGHDFAVRN